MTFPLSDNSDENYIDLSVLFETEETVENSNSGTETHFRKASPTKHFINSVKTDLSFSNKKVRKGVELIYKTETGYHTKCVSTLNDTAIFPLVDSGATCSILPYHLLKHFKYTKLNENVNLFTFSNEKVPILGVYKVVLFLEGFGIIKHRFLVISNENTTPILGLDILQRTRAHLVFDEHKGKHFISYPISYVSNKLCFIPVSDITLAPQSVSVQKCYFSSPHNVEVGQLFITMPTVYTLPSLMRIEQVNKGAFCGNLVCVNSSDQEVTLPKSEIKASVHDKKLRCFSDYKDSVELTLYKVEKDIFDNLSSVAPIFEKKSEENNEMSNSDLQQFVHKISSLTSKPPRGVDTALLNECLNAAIFSNVYCDPSESVNTLVEGGDISGGLPTGPPSGKERERLLLAEIEKLNIDEDVRNILLNNLDSLSASKWDTGKTLKPVSFQFNPSFKKETKIYKCQGEKLTFLKEQLSILQFNNFIERVNSNFGVPAFVVGTKQRNNLRLVFDARQSNTEIFEGHRSRTFLPQTQEICEKISDNARFITKLDLSKCFWSFQLDNKIIESGFSQILTPLGCFRSKRAITGWSILPNFLETYMNHYLQSDAQGQYSPLASELIPFFDDINLFSDDTMGREFHLSDLDSTLKRIARSGLRISLAKSEWAIDLKIKSLQVLGFELSYKKISAIPGKLDTIKKVPLPDTLLKLQRYLGSLVYYKKLLSMDVSGGIATLYNYCSAEKFDYKSEEYRRAFKQVTNNLIDSALIRPSPGSLSLLFTDSSAFCSGGTLCNIEAATFARKKFKAPNFHGYICQDLLKRLSRDNDWISHLKVGTSKKDIFECLFDCLTWVKDTHRDVDSLKENLLIRVYRNMREHSALFPFNENKKRHIFNELFHNLESAEKKFDISEEYRVFLKSAMLLEFTRHIQREIIFLNNSKVGFFRVGRPYLKPPLILFESPDLYYGLYSEKSFLNYPSTLSKTVDTLEQSEILPMLEKCLKGDRDAPLIKPVGFYSRSLSAAERKRPVWVLELNAIYSALEFFTTEVAASRTIVLSDSLPSVSLLNSKKYNLHINPTLLKLANNFPDVGYVYVKGEHNCADFFSRPPRDEEIQAKDIQYPKPVAESEKLQYFSSYDQFLSHRLINDTQEQTSRCQINNLKMCNSEQQDFFSRELSKVSFQIQSQQFPPTNKEKFVSSEFGFKDISTEKIYLPESLQFALIARTHLEFGHCSFRKILNYILYYFEVNKKSLLIEKIKTFVNSCVGCLLSKPNNIKFERGAIFNDLKLRFSGSISIDIMEFSQSDLLAAATLKAGKVLVIIDHATKYMSTFLLKTGSDEEITRALFTWFSANRIPQILLSDNASAMKSASLLKALKSVGVKVMRSAPRNSKSRGRVENGIKKLRNQIRLLRLVFPSLSPQVLISLATPIVNSTNFIDQTYSPKIQRDLCLFDRFPFLRNHNSTSTSCHEIRRKINREIQKIRQSHIQSQDQKLKKLNKGRAGKNYFKVGDFVLVKSYSNNKSKPLFSNEIYTIKDVYDHSVLLVRLIDGLETVQTFNQVKLLSQNNKCHIPKKLIPYVDLVSFENSTPNLGTKFQNLSEIDSTNVQTRSQKKKEDNQLLDELDDFENEDLGPVTRSKTVSFKL